MNTWLSLLPPLIAIGIAIASRQVFVALFAGVWVGWTVLVGGNPILGLAASLEAIVEVFASASNTKVILFSALVGSLIALTQRLGGVQGFISWTRARQVANSHRSVGLLAYLTGWAVFVESSITCLVVGSVSRPLADEVKMPREKLAYICDSTSAPVCILIPLNAWGAYIMGLLAENGVDNPLAVLLASIPLNFYALAALATTLFVVLSNRNIGPMRRAERRAREEGKVLADGATPLVADEVTTMAPHPQASPQARRLILPIATMVLMMPLGLYITGVQAIRASGDESLSLMRILGEGSGSTSVLWAVCAGIAMAGLLNLFGRTLSVHEFMETAIKGAAGLMPMAAIMILAFAINNTCGALGTGPYIAELTRPFLAPALIPAVLFGTAALIAFSTGTSWGTFGIMIPIGLPLAFGLDASLALTTAAILSGGIFGDHASPDFGYQRHLLHGHRLRSHGSRQNSAPLCAGSCSIGHARLSHRWGDQHLGLVLRGLSFYPPKRKRLTESTQ